MPAGNKKFDVNDVAPKLFLLFLIKLNVATI